VPLKNPLNMAPIAEFYADCAAGTLPSVSFVDPEIGVLNVAGSDLAGAIPIGNGVSQFVAAQDQDEENPADIQLGESFIEGVVKAVLSSPAWPRTLIVWTYDEHGGYYDHVPPPAAIAPDSIKPELSRTDIPGGYDVYGPRVPAVVASPYSKPHGVTNVVHDHTSVLATIEAKWNLPAMTYRDANATTIADFLDTSKPALLHPPQLTGSGDVLGGELRCTPVEPKLKVLPAQPNPRLPHVGRLVLRAHVNRVRKGVTVSLHTSSGTLSGLQVELVRHGGVIASKRVASVGTHSHRLVVHVRHRLTKGAYLVRVRHAGRTLARQALEIR
jgi:hypothetical protein